MRFDKLKKQLELLILLSDGCNYMVEELYERMNLPRRNFYYLLDFIKHTGFTIFKNQGCYHIDCHSPFSIQLLQTIQFTDKDVKMIHSVPTMTDNDSEMVNQLGQKLEGSYSFSVSAESPIRRQMKSNSKLLRKAMVEKKTVRLTGYSSPHSRSVRDRLVRPFLLLHNNKDICCHELVSK